jgi:hypothetical protein
MPSQNIPQDVMATRLLSLQAIKKSTNEEEVVII